VPASAAPRGADEDRDPRGDQDDGPDEAPVDVGQILADEEPEPDQYEPAPEQQLVRALLLRLVSPERTRAIVPVEELKELSPDRDEVERLTQHLVQARLLVVQTGGPGAGATVELVHESLIQTWPMLKRWLDEGQEDVAFLEQLRGAARQWAANRRNRDLLWRGDLVEEARRFRRRYRGELPSQQGEFLDAVLANAGFTLCGLALLAPMLDSGRLSLPFPVSSGTWTVHTFQARFRSDALARPQVRRFREWLAAEADATRQWLVRQTTARRARH
jgi:hypothetical protein